MDAIKTGINHKINIIGSPEYKKCITKAVKAALFVEKVNYGCEINIKITDNANIKRLNKKVRGVDSATDVLSFPMIESNKTEYIKSPDRTVIMNVFSKDINPENGLLILGDVIISAEKAKEQSEELEQSLERELMFLAIHATLHLLGFDHELSEKADLLTRKKQRKIIEYLEKI